VDDVRTYTGTLILDLTLPHARSLKERRGPLRSLIQKFRNEGMCVAQVGPPDLQQRAFLAVAVVSGSSGQVEDLLDAAERLAFASGFEVGEVRRLTGLETFPSGF